MHLNTLWLVLLMLWAAWVIQAVLAVMKVRHFSRRVGDGRGASYAGYRPRATLIVPFKGIDDDLPAAIKSLCAQDYPDYRLLCVVESEEDPAFAALERELANWPACESRILVAGIAPPTVGQKVHNQLHVLDAVAEELADDEVLAFADSDAVPDARWLGNMVGPLYRDEYGVTTGYRWLIPEAGREGRITLASHLASVINGSVACLSGFRGSSLAWGGSMAMRVSTAREGDLHGRMRGAITDDHPITLMCRALGKRVYFVRDCLVASPVAFTFASMWNFGHRQYLITRVYLPWVFAGAMAVTMLYVTAWLAAAAALAWSLAEQHWLHAALPLGFMIVVHGLNHVRSHYRRQIVRRVFGAAMVAAMRRTLRLDRWATAGWMTLHLMILLRSSVGRTMWWRGIRYRLRGKQAIERLG